MLASTVISDLQQSIAERGDFEVQIMIVNIFGEKVMCEVVEIRPFGRDLVVRVERAPDAAT
jgi:hypothetical protein